jgi:signal transduction histidine kinase
MLVTDFLIISLDIWVDNPGAPGNGMGLTIVKQIAEPQHGKVWVEDGVGGGTTFAIWLPEIVSNI